MSDENLFLSDAEAEQLAAYEAKISAGLQTLYEVGAALLAQVEDAVIALRYMAKGALLVKDGKR